MFGKGIGNSSTCTSTDSETSFDYKTPSVAAMHCKDTDECEGFDWYTANGTIVLLDKSKTILYGSVDCVNIDTDDSKLFVPLSNEQLI
uniref:Uncharacterized protein n=1 Tax=Pithovirus LCDPAC01 TaxID=2506600 RepID=A0A481YN57_9VIRU|nr:MAG: hypothetical protein LCDPAC01_00280 [Pithovirus LCDPAC01]